MKKILIIGKKSFVAKNINVHLKNSFILKNVHYSRFNKISKKNLIDFDYIINCSISKKYVTNKYSELNDLDFKIAKKIFKFPIKMIFLSSRKVYEHGDNLKEASKLNPRCHYSKNKLITEKKLIKILAKKVLILRISNLIGKLNANISHRKIHHTFIDNFYFYLKKGVIFNNKKLYKDFLTVKKFCEILKKLINIKTNGIYNISIGEKIFLKDLVGWLNYYNINKKYHVIDVPDNFNKECFYLNNLKLKKKININISKLELKRYCINLSKNFFQ
jgi:hypothetical protein